MLFAALLLTAVALTSAADDEAPWWQTSVVYQIYPRSFSDSDFDGIGDLDGIASKLGHLKDIGIGAVWLSPIYDSPNHDYGYDVRNYTGINKEYGDMAKFNEMVKAFKKNEIKLIMDFVPNHSSDEHPWFNKSANREDKYVDYYVWRNGTKKNTPPNNWVNMDGKSAWTYHPGRGQYYYHVFSEHQPDLNYSNPAVMQEMKDAMTFWLNAGVSGFRMDAVPYLAEDTAFHDEDRICNETVYSCLNHTYTKDTDGTHDILHEFRLHLDKYKKDKNLTEPLFMVLEATTGMDQILKYFDSDTIPFNFNLMSLNRDSNSTDYVDQIKPWLTIQKDGKWNNWFTGNHDSARVPTRFDKELTDALNMIVMLLPGTPFTYYGEDIGMEDVILHNITDMRLQARTPYQWDDTVYAGFTNTTPWLPVHPDYWQTNVKSEKSANGKSHLSVYKELVTLHKKVQGADVVQSPFSDYVYGFYRKMNTTYYLVVVNLDNVQESITLKDTLHLLDDKFPESLTVRVASVNAEQIVGSKVSTGDKLTLRPRTGLVLSTATAGAVSFLGGPSMTLMVAVLLAAYIFGPDN